MNNFGYRNKFDDLVPQNDRRPKYSVREMAEILKVDLSGLKSLISRSEQKPTPISYKTVNDGKKTALYDKIEFAKWFKSTGARIKSASKEPNP